MVMVMMMGKMMIIMTMMAIYNYGDARFVSVQMNKLFRRFYHSFKTTERLANYRS